MRRCRVEAFQVKYLPELPLFRTQSKDPEVLAAVDLGSNSFHMIVARLTHGQPNVIDRLREMVRLAGGLDADKRLDPEREEIALACLARFGQRLRDFQADSVRVVGTNTLRRLGQHSKFVRQAARAIEHPIEIISGIEEARLIYQGVYFSSPSVEGPRLVIDIGGGSTEIIRGQDLATDAMESLHIGCVSLSERAFPKGKITKSRFRKARLKASLELEPIRENFRRIKPERASGASGTIRAAQSVLDEINGEPTIMTIDSLEDLIDRMVHAGHVDDLDLPGLSEQRRPVFPGGIAILVEVMKNLGLGELHVADGALKEGLLYDMVGRLSNLDARDLTVQSMETRFSIDQRQADRVEKTALTLLDQVAEDWALDEPLHAQLLRWAARLHELGLHISHSKYHHHGAYLLENSDMPGFPVIEQRLLARLVGEQRGRLDRQFFADIPEDWEEPARALTLLLRLAVLFNRSRSDQSLPEIHCSGTCRKFRIRLSAGREEIPLTWVDLENERRLLSQVRIKLKLAEPGDD